LVRQGPGQDVTCAVSNTTTNSTTATGAAMGEVLVYAWEYGTDNSYYGCLNLGCCDTMLSSMRRQSHLLTYLGNFNVNFNVNVNASVNSSERRAAAAQSFKVSSLT
jgi:hypothetical protein